MGANLVPNGLSMVCKVLCSKVDISEIMVQSPVVPKIEFFPSFAEVNLGPVAMLL